MSGDVIQAKYEMLEKMATQFGNESDVMGEINGRVQQAVDALQNGGWEGQGSQAFLSEMADVVFPASTRLIEALAQAQSVTLQIKDILQEADEEASAPFRGDGTFGGAAGTLLAGSAAAGGAGEQMGGGTAVGGLTGSGSTTGSSDSIWDHFESKGGGEGWSWEQSKDGKFNPGIGIKYGLKDHAVYGDPNEDGFSAFGGNVKGGLGYSAEDGLVAGVSAEYYTAQAKIDGVYGDKDLAATGGLTGKALAADGFFGYKDGSVGASIGGTLVSAEGEAGMNVAGVNVGVKGEIGLKAELGFKIGRKTEIKLPFITLGFSFGSAK
ncbi:MAG: WXG100 family type VII secretion target [Chloroflexi bacterium]|nr:WXG100 family type VII secretion target [Chloroflexota bacterium]